MASHLIVVMDTNPAAWSLQAQYGRKGLKYDAAVSSVVAFLRAFVLLGPSNSFSFLAAHAKQSLYIYPPEQETPSPSSSPSATSATTTASQKRKRNEGINGPMPIILDRLHRLNNQTPAATTTTSSKDAADSDSDDDDDEVESLSLASALTRAMGRANVIRSNHAEKNIRILVILASMDYSSYYVPLMNTIFSAEHLNVRMDCLNICQARSKFMEQAVNQTNGVYQHLDGERGRERDGMLQHLLTHFLVPSDTNNALGLQKILGRSTSASNVDLRATCLETGLPISTGVVCSVCLSIFSLPAFKEMRLKACATCGTRWNLPSGKGGRGKGGKAGKRNRNR